MDQLQLILKYLKDVGIDAKLNQQEYGAYISTTFYGKYESMAFGPQTPFLEPDNFLYGQYYPGEIKNHGHINDPIAPTCSSDSAAPWIRGSAARSCTSSSGTSPSSSGTCTCGPASTSGSGTAPSRTTDLTSATTAAAA